MTPPILSRREREILDLILVGLLNKQIAEWLHVRPSTIETHRTRLMKKFSAKTAAELGARVIAMRAAHALACVDVLRECGSVDLKKAECIVQLEGRGRCHE